ncbi:MAG: ribokinase [Clostridiales bacterium]|jgi:ribokinase|nr:ribokinase [Clostridiales bacterium]
MKNILVIGSINMDMVITTPRLPKLGETIGGSDFQTIPGGKGANQAVAIARLGGNVKMLGCVGGDLYGEQLVKTLRENHVDTSLVSAAGAVSGVAVITVCGGDNHIILDRGANQHVTPQMIEQNADALQWADVVLFQMEIPQETILYAAKSAKKRNKTVLLNPAPAQGFERELLHYTDIIIPNRYEAEQLFGREIHTANDAEQVIRAAKSLGIGQVIITRGGEGCVYNNGGNIERQAALPVAVVDTTAAGDSFIGGFVTALCGGKTVPQSVWFASAVAALTVSKKGASSSLPTLNEVNAFAKQLK